MKNTPHKWITHTELKQKLLKNKGFREAYEAQELEFRILDAIIAARIKNKLTQKKLAEKIGIAQSALARFESGRTNPRLSTLQKIMSEVGLKLVVK